MRPVVRVMNFVYGDEEIAYLKKRDKKLGAVIERVGYIDRPGDDDLFTAVVRNIVGQQISTAAMVTVWRRMSDAFSPITADALASSSVEHLQSFGMTFKKAGYIKGFAEKVSNGDFDIYALHEMGDADVIKALSSLDGIGVWTAEMIMIFCMGRPDVLSFGDLAILRGMRMVYRRKKIDRAAFEMLRRRYSPYGTVASLYIWAVAGGALAELTDPAAKKTSGK